MSDCDMTDVHAFFFTRSTVPTEPQDFYRSMREHLPGACPATFHKHEDELHAFRDDNLPLFGEMWWQGFVFWESPADCLGDAFLGTTFKLTRFAHAFPTHLASEQDCKNFLIETAVALRADYAYLHVLPQDEVDIRPDDGRIGGMAALDLPNGLPGLPWAACYGKPYTGFFGKEKLLSLPVAEAREVGPDTAFCQLTDRLLDCVTDTARLDERRRAVYEVLGRDAFFDPAAPERVARGPEFRQPLVTRPTGE
jgi:hypothetical protein